MVGERFYINDGYIFPVEQQDKVSGLEITVPNLISFDDIQPIPPEVVAVITTFSMNESSDRPFVFLTKPDIENIIVYLNKILGEIK